jgi:cytochrome P450
VPAVITDPDTYLTGVPYAELAELRRSTPVARVDDFWAVLRHADVRRVLRDPRVFSSHLGGTQIRDPATEADLAYVRRMMLNSDPPDHARLRNLLTRAFTPRAVARLTERIQGWARDLVAAVADQGECDFATDLTDMARGVLAVRPTPGPDGALPDPRSRNGMPDLYAYANALGEHKRHHPGDDVMSILMRHVGDDGGRVSLAEFENLFWLFSVAGNETLRNGLPGGLFALLTHPEQYRALLADRSLLPGAVDEMLRWWTPVMHFRRTATTATRLGDVDIRAGEKVVVWFTSANRDESVFRDPDAFDITRTPNDHLTFGHGPHFCLGAGLARIQMRAMFDAVLDTLGEVEPAGDPVRLRSNFQHGLKHLPIRWRSRHAGAGASR